MAKAKTKPLGEALSDPRHRCDGAYGCYVIGDSMSPAYEQGDLLLVHPVRPVRAGDDVILSRDPGDGTRQAIVRRLVRVTSKTWGCADSNRATLSASTAANGPKPS